MKKKNNQMFCTARLNFRLRIINNRPILAADSKNANRCDKMKIIISAIFIVISVMLFYYSMFLGWASGAGIPEQVGYLKKYSNYALLASFISFWLAILIWPFLSKLKNRRTKQVTE
jgi:hypothetical protein